MIFVDTWAWVALADRSDPHHEKAKAQHKKLRRARDRYVTSDFVLGETITYLFDALPFSQAEAFISAMLAAADQEIADVFTGDNHFRQVNLGFRLFP